MPNKKRPLKICIVIPTLRAGGAEKVVTKLANHWAQQGQEVFLVTLVPPEEQPFYPLVPSVKLIQLNQPLLNRLSSLSSIFHMIRRIVTLRKIIRRLRSDIVISFMTTTNLTVLTALIGTTLPVVISERIDPRFHEISDIYKKIRLFLYRKAKALIVQTNSIKKYFPGAIQEKTKVIPNFIETPCSKKGASTGIKNIITFGRLDPQKDHPTLIKAFSQLHARYPSLLLTIYGEGPERPKLETLIASLDLQNHINLPGLVKDIYPALAQADLFVFPSRYEGFPNALGEAMSVGLPVIASNCPGNKDLVQDKVDGRLFPVGDVEVLSQLIEELLTDSKQRSVLAHEALKVTKRFSEAKILKMWDELIKECAKT